MSKISKKTAITFAAAIILWVTLPLTSQSTAYTRSIELGIGYTPVVDLRQHHAPPKIKGRVYKDIVWRHERYSFLWLPLGGSKAGQYGLYKSTNTSHRRGSRFSHKKSFIPLPINQARDYARTVNVELPDTSPVSSWALYFGWLVIPLLGFVFVVDRRFLGKIGF